MDYFEPMRARRAEFEEKPGEVEEILRAGVERARALAMPILEECRRAAGLACPGRSDHAPLIQLNPQLRCTDEAERRRSRAARGGGMRDRMGLGRGIVLVASMALAGCNQIATERAGSADGADPAASLLERAEAETSKPARHALLRQRARRRRRRARAGIEALRWLTLAAEAESPEAASDLGIVLATADGKNRPSRKPDAGSVGRGGPDRRPLSSCSARSLRAVRTRRPTQ